MRTVPDTASPKGGAFFCDRKYAESHYFTAQCLGSSAGLCIIYNLKIYYYLFSFSVCRVRKSESPMWEGTVTIT